ncbi:MAG: glycosyltransferase [Proteobacteria bacterium]|nr:glycosyltransferase [Pseudomonadota bacterium]
MPGKNASNPERALSLEPSAAGPAGTGHFVEYAEQVTGAHRAILARGAAGREASLERHRYYYDQLRDLIRSIVAEGERVLCLRSDVGQYLDWVQPARGLGIEVVPELTEIARARHPQYQFRTGDVESLALDETFDTILIVNAVNELFDVQATLENLHSACTPRTRIVIVFYNFLWQPAARLAERLGIKRSQPEQSWLSFSHLTQLLTLAGFESVRRYKTVLLPFYVPGLSWLANRVVANLPVLERLCMVQAVVARPAPAAEREPEAASVSVIVPCKDEAGNVEACVLRTPEMGSGTELIFCDDRSTDGTADEVRRMQREHPERNIRLVDGPGISKAENVWTGFAAAQGDIVMILDGDLAVPPEELPKFYDALVRRRGEFVNGSRMVYPMREDAMRMANIFGNKLFSLLFSHILREEISDTLCGTKALWRADCVRIRALRGSWGVRDRWGDYELIFGAARLNLKHVDLPVHYMERTYGELKMTGRLRNALVMLRMCFAAFLTHR